MLTYLIGVYEGDRDPCSTSILACKTDMKVAEAKKAIRQAAVEFLSELAYDGGYEMPYPYNFGDIVEMTYDDAFVKCLADHGIDVVDIEPFQADSFDLDRIWVREDDIRERRETVMSKQDSMLKIEFCDINEGCHGDWNPDDPDDYRHIRFYAYVRAEDGGWDEVEDGSYCTLMPVDGDPRKLHEALDVVFSEYRAKIDSYMNGQSLKKLGEMLSWTVID